MAMTLTAEALLDRRYRTALGVYRFGRNDPTTRLDGNEFWRATITPDGPGTLHISWDISRYTLEAWGPGANWMIERAPYLLGEHDQPHQFVNPHPVIAAAQRNHPYLRIGSSGMLYHELIPVVIGQRITAQEAVGQWHRLVRQLGEPAPGPREDLVLPPAPQRLAEQPGWWFHPLGIELKRAHPLIELGRQAQRLWSWSQLPSGQCAEKLALLRGIGQWTIGSALGPALGDPDSIAVGDFHLKNQVAFALAGEARATDERMIELLQPYSGQRGRVTRLLGLEGFEAPKFGPRQRIQPMSRR